MHLFEVVSCIDTCPPHAISKNPTTNMAKTKELSSLLLVIH